jgi:aromatic amino acid transport protein AroP
LGFIFSTGGHANLGVGGSFVAINAINLTNVKVYGEMEFWFSIKVAAIISMIAFGGYLLFSGSGGPEAGGEPVAGRRFLPERYGLVMAMAVIMFSFGGLELVGITAAEADNPQKSIPKATNQVIYRILLFYVGSLAVLLSLYPWKRGGRRQPVRPDFPCAGQQYCRERPQSGGAPPRCRSTTAVYCNSRMLFGLAQQGNAPRSLLKVNRRDPADRARRIRCGHGAVRADQLCDAGQSL